MAIPKSKGRSLSSQAACKILFSNLETKLLLGERKKSVLIVSFTNPRILNSSRTLLASGELMRLVNHDEKHSPSLDSRKYG